ncbi:2OG-Fe(II)oxygenase [Colletotrichum asianum]|uniref:2OG-Fe(II)oxygenase n=1 Tax=Colletotrichum asianum TaxID=702518 RepID=A0A8H3VZ15_9PEZI|nr:2OG-Fe(II)oxygenase [Colletotrichum asianum]
MASAISRPKSANTVEGTSLKASWLTVTSSLIIFTSIAISILVQQTKPSTQSAPLLTTIVSYDPLIIHVEDFLTSSEVQHLLDLATYQPSTVIDDETGRHDRLASGRRSSTAMLPRGDAVVQSVITRSARFQGFVSEDQFEQIQATRYLEGGEYVPHYDTLSARRPLDQEGERLTTIFAFLDDSCGSHCGTQFPRIAIDWDSEDKRWCEIVDCQARTLTFRPRAGSAVFWKNLRDNGSLHEDTLHAGLPVQKGSKIGLNIWMREKLL